ncbi:TIGR03364 family FAD-dependent oxidoreductase [Saccharopolyspora rosea]|uniref:TIGR03364 family FAD-dependent oxidoreductase n=1 Tax=Saccharopolyspora rosea TaxID=524884 RepID=A0ABW3FRY7_9PSEU|nr:TIGR03364 family FAD-dependent oxidoreductase [Saccharopolyspora rosea]
MNRADVAVVGGGIVGLAHALAVARRGARVVLFERDERAVGASLRNFGLLWPIGQPGDRYERALRSREIWLEMARRAGLWCAEVGSLHLAYHADEQAVLEEFLDTTPAARERGCRLLTPAEVADASDVVVPEGLRAALWSPTEVNVDPRQAIPGVAAALARDFGVELRFGTAVRGISLPHVETTSGTWRVDRVFVCSGNEFQALYPEVFADSGIRRCKLQMLRTGPQPAGWALGPTLCAGLTLLHYQSFAHCTSLAPLRQRFGDELPFHREHGIHVLVSQTASGEVTIGDSHAYGDTHDPFEHEAVNRAILDYFEGFAAIPRPAIAERWHGVYPSLPDGRAHLVVDPEPGVTVVNGLGGAGMTLSFGLADDTVSQEV